MSDSDCLNTGERFYSFKKRKPPYHHSQLPLGDYLLFNGKKLFWMMERRPSVWITKHSWDPAKSGLEKDHPKIKTLIESGRTDIKIDGDYTDPKYQHVSDVGPIPTGDYRLELTDSMTLAKTNQPAVWGIGGWPIYPDGWISRKMGSLDHWLSKQEKEWNRTPYLRDLHRANFDIPKVRFGFFLHHDVGGDGTSGCIGVSETAIKELKCWLILYRRQTDRDKIDIVVDYNRIVK